MLYDPRRSNIPKIERESGVKFEHISAPQANDIAKAVGREAAEMIMQVSDRYVFIFWYKDSYVFICLFCVMLYFSQNMS